MSRPGAWARVMTNFWKYLRKDWSTKHYIGEDAIGHRYYEIQNTRQNVTRGYDPPPNNPTSEPGVEWQSWLKGTRRFPPSEEEIAINQMKGQAQLAENEATERRAPHVTTKDTAGSQNKPAAFPQYEDMESAPGAKKSR